MSAPAPLPNTPRPTYSWRDLHKDLETNRHSGTYGAHNAAYHALAGIRAGVNMADYHTKRSPDEFYVEELKWLIEQPETQKRWDDIITMDPMGMFAPRPTQSATTAKMMIPELMTGSQLEADGVIVNSDLTINCVKCAIDHAWNLPQLAHRLKMDENHMRKCLAEATQNEKVLDKSCNAYLPPIGGITLYFFGDIKKLADKTTPVAVRVHDECSGSDVFGTDICTCRPYLVFAIQGAVECAQRGGVGIIAYFRKEGRSLGEVTKFRVYNARKRQQGGDTAENYFKQTESIAGIRDARFQEMMPDVLLWLGIERVDYLLSMSADKYDAITGAGIKVMQRVSLPDSYVPEGATVEITAKISAGYHSEKVISRDDVVNELRELTTVRARTAKVFELAKAGKSDHFNLHMDKLPACVDFVLDVTKKNYPDFKSIPYHSRWRHFRPNDVEKLAATWKCDEVEKARRLIDLVTVSVFLDAGAGNAWHYIDADGVRQERSEGLAIATFDMFKDGIFSSDPAVPCRVNSVGLANMTTKQFAKGLQLSENNPITGFDGRFQLLQRLGKALEQFPEYFGDEICRPGNIIDYLLRNADSKKSVSLKVLWKAVILGFEPIWPAHLSGVRRGDVWAYSPLKVIGSSGSDLVPFHKLSQWLTYSLLEPLESLNIQLTELELMTGLAEYRNGGLFVDMGVITPKLPETLKMDFDPGNEFVVEWRALTVQLVDTVWAEILKRTGMTKEQLPLAKILQGGTWAAGRLAAMNQRGNRTAPISVRSDGTVF